MRSQIIDRGHPASPPAPRAARRGAPSAPLVHCTPARVRPAAIPLAARLWARSQVLGRLSLTAIFALAALAQAPSNTVVLLPNLTSGSVLTYSVAIHSAIGSRATLDTS